MIYVTTISDHYSIHTYVISWNFSRYSCQLIFSSSLLCQEVKNNNIFCDHLGPLVDQKPKWPSLT